MELPDTVEIAHVSKVEFSRSGRIAIVDSRDYNVKLFDASGHFVTSVGHRGVDPGGVGGRHAIEFSGDTLLVVDDHRQVLMYFSLRENRLLRETAVSARPLTGLLAVGDWYIIAGYGPWRRETGQVPEGSLQVVDRSGRLVRSLAFAPAYYWEHPRLWVASVPLIAPDPSSESELYLTWRYAGEVRRVDVDGATITRARLPASHRFRDPEPVFDSLAVAGADPDALSEVTSPISHVVASADRIAIGYYSAYTGDTRLRYHLLDADLDIVATNITGLPLRGSRADTLLAFRPGSRRDQSLLPQLVYYVACPRSLDPGNSAGRGQRPSARTIPKGGI